MFNMSFYSNFYPILGEQHIKFSKQYKASQIKDYVREFKRNFKLFNKF